MNKKINNTITFIPFYGNGNAGYYNNANYFDDKYLDLQFKLIEMFSRHTQFNFIVKCVKTNPRAQFSKITKDWISYKKYSNIIYRDDNLIKSLLITDKVIMDFPGSSVYEVFHYKIDALVMYYEGLRIRKSALNLSNNIKVNKFTDITSGVTLAEKFILDN